MLIIIITLYSNQTMGSYISKDQEELFNNIQKEYQIEAEPYLTHRDTQQLCTLHKITSSAATDVNNINQSIEEYQRTKCESISKLKASYHLDNTGYCSDQQNFYLVFEGQNNYNIREELGKRRLFRHGFNEQEIEQITTALVCGLREYDHRFQREYDHLSLECMALDQETKRIYLKDPWLIKQPQRDDASSSLNFYPSPQKLSSIYENKLQEYDAFQANLFTAGAIALELNALEPTTSIYVHKRQVNYAEISAKLGQLKGEKLRKGVECLLHPNPVQRKKIYQLWGIENQQVHILQPIQTHREQPTLSKGKSQKKPQENVSKFQFSAYINKPTLNKQQSGTVIPQPIQSPMASQAQASSNRSLKISNPNKLPNFINTIQYNPPRPQTLPTPALSPSITIPTYQPSTLFNPPTFHFPETRPTIINSILDPPKTVLPPFIGQKPPNFSEILARQVKKSSSGDLHSLIKEQPIPIIIPKIPEIPAKTVNNLPSDLAFHSLASYKESFTYYEPIDKRPQFEQIRNESIKTHADSPPKPQQKHQILYQPPIEIIQQKKPPAITITKEQPIQQAAPDTPQRPPTKNKFNSTIVQVRDEDSPEHSAKSEEANQEEYVVEEYQTGSRYQGFKSNNMRNGRGKFYYQDGGYYEGQWKNNKMDGFGRLYYEGGKLAYEGNWSQDQFNGHGKVYNDNPVELTTPFDYRNFQLLQDYWQYYQGMLSHDTKEGRGRIKLSNGEIFQGDFHNDRIQGFGKFSSLDGSIIQGIWRQSVLIKTINNLRN